MAAGDHRSLFVDSAGRLLACGRGAAVGHGDPEDRYPLPTPVAAMAGIRVRNVAVGYVHSLALGWDGRVYSWGENGVWQLGHLDTIFRPSPELVEGLEGVCSIATGDTGNLAATQLGDVFRWGKLFMPEQEDALRPVMVEGFMGVRECRVCYCMENAFAVGEHGEMFSWGYGDNVRLGHGDTHNQPLPKRVEALRNVRVSTVAVGFWHVLVLAENGLVYAWGENEKRALLGGARIKRALLPAPCEALRDVRVISIAAAYARSYAVADTGELWAWGVSGEDYAPIGHGKQMGWPVPKPVESLRGTKVDAVSACDSHTLALADDGCVYAWGDKYAAINGALGLCQTMRVRDAMRTVRTTQRTSALRVTCGL
jgi:alpha-tubulin suppressor-like RCC1 family protein